VAILLGLGSMIGGVMAESGAALSICNLLLGIFGEKRILWVMLLLGLLIGLPVFFEVGFVLLVPLAIVLARRTGLRPMYVGLPLLAGLSIAHGLVPPHPAVMLATVQYHADIGRTMLFGLLIGIPSAALAGPVYTWLVYRGRSASTFALDEETAISEEHVLPNAFLSFCLLLLPIILISLGTFTVNLLADGGAAKSIFHFIGSPDIALFITLIACLVVLSGRPGKPAWSRYEQIIKDSLLPTANILMLLAAAGAFGRVLQDSGASAATVRLALHAHIPLLLLAWLIAVMVRQRPPPRAFWPHRR